MCTKRDVSLIGLHVYKILSVCLYKSDFTIFYRFYLNWNLIVFFFAIKVQTGFFLAMQILQHTGRQYPCVFHRSVSLLLCMIQIVKFGKVSWESLRLAVPCNHLLVLAVS